MEKSQLEIEMKPGGWAYIYWNHNDMGRMPVSLIKELKGLEKYLKDSNGSGWICNSELEHTEMHRLLLKFGASVYAETQGLLWFKKEIRHVQKGFSTRSTADVPGGEGSTQLSKAVA